jgi:putative tryptophan/tyrosine transport system substrate-binding protein
MRRREFILLVGGATAWPFAAGAQQPAKVHRVGILVQTRVEREHLIDAFKRGLQELGYIEGKNVAFEIRSAEGRYDRLASLATELANLQVAVIFADTTVAVQAAEKATTKIPIVMGSPGDPVGTRLVSSLARPGGNVTGTTTQAPELSRKRLQLLKELLPGAARFAVLWESSNLASAENWRETQDAARSLGMVAQSYAVHNPAELNDILGAIRAAGMNGLVVLPSAVLFSEKRRIAEFAIKNRLPTMFEQREHVEAGGLVGYGPNLSELYRHTASFVDKILKGAKPADLPVEQPTKFALIINLKTAKAIGLEVPESFLLRAEGPVGIQYGHVPGRDDRG